MDLNIQTETWCLVELTKHMNQNGSLYTVEVQAETRNRLSRGIDYGPELVQDVIKSILNRRVMLINAVAQGRSEPINDKMYAIVNAICLTTEIGLHLDVNYCGSYLLTGKFEQKVKNLTDLMLSQTHNEDKDGER